jgi:hypothetical protein
VRRACWPMKPVSGVLILLFALSCSEIGSAQQEPQGNASSSTQAYPDAPDPQSGQTAQAKASSQQQGGDTRPLGTAAALDMKPTGVTGSMLSGAAIAPAKQRRVKIIFISLGVVAAAGIAVGTVAALSHGSPSHPH